MRQASIHADGEMDAQRAIAVLRDVIQIEPAHQDAYYLLAQQYFLLGASRDARAAIDRVIELADRARPAAVGRGARSLLLLQGPDPRRLGRRPRRGAAVPARDRVRPGLRAACARARAARCRLVGDQRQAEIPADRGRPRRDGAGRTARRRAAAAWSRAHSVVVRRSPRRDRGVPRHPQRRARRRRAIASRSPRSTPSMIRPRDRRAAQGARPRHPPRARVSPARVVLHRTGDAERADPRAHRARPARVRRGDRSPDRAAPARGPHQPFRCAAASTTTTASAS